MASATQNPQATGISAQEEEEVHYGVRCDGCRMEPIRGERYKCDTCYNYDHCRQCVSTKRHKANHSMSRKKVRASQQQPYHCMCACSKYHCSVLPQ